MLRNITVIDKHGGNKGRKETQSLEEKQPECHSLFYDDLINYTTFQSVNVTLSCAIKILKWSYNNQNATTIQQAGEVSR